MDTAIARSLSPIERKVLPFLKDGMSLGELVKSAKVQEAEARRALLWLENRKLIKQQVSEESFIGLNTFGFIAKEKGLSEARILEMLKSDPVAVQKIVQKDLPLPEIMSAIGALKRLGAVDVLKEGKSISLKIIKKITIKKPILLRKTFPVAIATLSSEEKKEFKELSRRKDFFTLIKKKHVSIKLLDLGKELQKQKLDFSNIEEQLTVDMLKSGAWKEKEFRVFDVESRVPAIIGGRRHPMSEAINIIRDVYLQMGFQEMKGPWVETAFWCMDSMWIPQDHPARDEQDTFFIGKKGDIPAVAKKVKEAHENGLGTGSTGHTKQWSEEIAKELLLRTHSTATTFRMFGEHDIKDGKYFCVDTVFRNEAVDATHLAEFIQAEGFVIGDNLTLSDLMGFIKEFYARLGIHKIRFKPTFNPYTEPSLEAHYYDEHKKKWYALINSGIFRPESLAPYGLANKTVIAWGMGGSRVAALLNHTNNLRELVGPTVSFDWIAQHKTPQPKLD